MHLIIAGGPSVRGLFNDVLSNSDNEKPTIRIVSILTKVQTGYLPNRNPSFVS
jgi:hypothetical protein